LNPDEPKLAERARAGDREAFAALVDCYLPRVRRFLYRLNGARGNPDDMVQETFLVATRSLGNLREPAHFGTWLFGIAFRVQRSRARRGDVMVGEPADASSVARFPVDAWITREEHALVLEALEGLPEGFRDAFLLRHVEDLSFAEVARILEIPEGSARDVAHARLQSLLP
jgi:RNA polymerase sigma-70 factor (ECF subfamily)